jgi:hypothetical protein
MRSLTLASFGLVVAVAACGGRVDEDPSPTGTTPGSTNTPSNAPAATGCAGACDRFRECTSAFEDRTECVRDCGREFPDPARARVYASCIQALSCEWIERGLSMDYGPIGECYTKAGR